MFRHTLLIGSLSLIVLSGCGSSEPEVNFRNTPGVTATGSTDQPDFTNERMPESTDSLEVGTGSGASDLIRTASGTIFIGKDDAPALTVYTDYSCEYCREFSLEHQPELEDAFVDSGMLRLKLVYIPRDDAGMFMAKTALCSAEQNLFRSADREMSVRPISNEKELPTFAKKVGLNLKTLRSCMGEKSLDESLQTAKESASGAGISRIPAFSLGTSSWIGLMQEDELHRTIRNALTY